MNTSSKKLNLSLIPFRNSLKSSAIRKFILKIWRQPSTLRLIALSTSQVTQLTKTWLSPLKLMSPFGTILKTSTSRKAKCNKNLPSQMTASRMPLGSRISKSAQTTAHPSTNLPLDHSPHFPNFQEKLTSARNPFTRLKAQQPRTTPCVSEHCKQSLNTDKDQWQFTWTWMVVWGTRDQKATYLTGKVTSWDLQEMKFLTVLRKDGFK